MARATRISRATPWAISSGPDSPFRNWVTADGAPVRPERAASTRAAGALPPDRVARLPWAHRTLIFRKLKGLESMISLSVVNWLMARAWLDVRSRARRDSRPDLRLRRRLSEFYVKARSRLHRPRHRARAVGQGHEHDRQQRVVRDHPHVQLAPSTLSARRRATIIPRRCGPRSTRSTPASTRPSTTASIAPASRPRRTPTRRPFRPVRDARLARSAAGASALPVRRAADRGGLAALHHARPLRRGLLRPLQVQPPPDRATTRRCSRYLRELYHWPGVAETVNFDHIKRHYYKSHRGINPTGIVPLGPEIKL